MKIQIFSDVHLEFGNFNPPGTDADVVVLAGDIHLGEQGVVWAAENFNGKEVIYVIGNHEYYHGAIPDVTEKILAQSVGTNVHVLENDNLIIDQVHFLGCTLWSDFKLSRNPDLSVLNAQRMMNDFRLVRLSALNRSLEPLDTEKWHRSSKKWLEEKLAAHRADNLKTVVITHHAPSGRSVPERYNNDSLSAAFASEMGDFIIDKELDLWIHGHIHDSSDYHIGNTRIICNPRGYVSHELNSDFIADLTVEV